jgi:alpha-tubulin suppressor-like RCC1 family protein
MATQDDINNFNPATNTVGDLLELSAQTYVDTTNRSIFVATVDDLPDLTNDTIIPGTVFYVESLGVPVVAQVGCWTGIDNRELRSDFVVGLTYSWGFNNVGLLGDGTTVSKLSPVSVIGGLNTWCQVSAGSQHSLGVRTNGTAWAWGGGGANVGELGDGTTLCKSSPVSVIGGFTDWCQVSAGTDHSLGVRTNGTAWAWGSGASGRLGTNTTTDRSSPVSVVGGFTDWCQVSAGGDHSLGVRTNGTLWAWGTSGAGRLGDGTVVSKNSPVSVVGGFTDWCQASAGSFHSVAVRTNGTAWAWGCGSCGRLGDGTATDRSSPVAVVGGFTDWCQVSAGMGGDAFSLGVRQNGTAWGWGRNINGTLGNNCVGSGQVSSPVSVVGGFTDWCQVSAGSAHSLGLRTNGTAWAWGDGGVGRLGDNTTSGKSSPVSIAGGLTNWCQVSAGDAFSFAIRSP